MKALLTPASRLWFRLRLNEIGPLLSFAGCGFFAWAFVAVADEVREGETHALDSRLLMALRDPQNPANPLGPPGWRNRPGTSPGSAVTPSSPS
jgi:undecaprenyl-diphosphatase